MGENMQVTRTIKSELGVSCWLIIPGWAREKKRRRKSEKDKVGVRLGDARAKSRDSRNKQEAGCECYLLLLLGRRGTR